MSHLQKPNKTICVYLGSNEGNDPRYAEAVRELGTWIGRNGYRLAYGGSKVGLMGHLAHSALEAGGYVIGVEPKFFIDSEMQLDELNELEVTDTMAERRTRLIEISDAFIAFPGGTGTLEEISEIMCSVSLDILRAPCIVYNLNGFYDHLDALLSHMEAEGFLRSGNRAKIRFCSTLEEIAEAIRSFNL